MINLFAVLFGLYLLCLLILVYQRKKQGDMNSFDKETAEKERRKENVGWLKVRTLEARENDLDEASRNELEQELGLVTLKLLKLSSGHVFSAHGTSSGGFIGAGVRRFRDHYDHD